MAEGWAQLDELSLVVGALAGLLLGGLGVGWLARRHRNDSATQQGAERARWEEALAERAALDGALAVATDLLLRDRR